MKLFFAAPRSGFAGGFDAMTDQEFVAKMMESLQQALAFVATARPPSDTEQ